MWDVASVRPRRPTTSGGLSTCFDLASRENPAFSYQVEPLNGGIVNVLKPARLPMLRLHQHLYQINRPTYHTNEYKARVFVVQQDRGADGWRVRGQEAVPPPRLRREAKLQGGG